MKEHDRIRTFFEAIEKNLSESPLSKAMFNKLRWNLEKHFFLEEKAIFVMFQKANSQEMTDIFDLMQEHSIITNNLRILEQDLSDKELVLEIKNSVNRHAKFEDETLYPMMEDYLNENQKLEIIQRIKEIVF
jgi:hypothetical protein